MLQLLDERQKANPEVTLSLDFAIVYQGLGRVDEAFRHLHEAVDRGMGAIVFFATSTIWNEMLRSDPRFDELLQRIKHPTVVPA